MFDRRVFKNFPWGRHRVGADAEQDDG